MNEDQDYKNFVRAVRNISNIPLSQDEYTQAFVLTSDIVSIRQYFRSMDSTSLPEASGYNKLEFKND